MMKKHLFALVLIGAAVVLAYSNSLNGTRALDDIVVNKPVGIKDVGDLMGFRKVAYLSFVLNRQIAPFSPYSFRLFNVILHMLNAFFVYLLGCRTFLLFTQTQGASTREKEQGAFSPDLQERAFAAGLLSGIVFALHPININAVAYIVQRMTSLAALFVLLSLHCVLSASQSRGARSLLLYGSGCILLVLGIFSKENAVAALPLFLLYDYVFLSRFDPGVFRKRAAAVILLGGAAIALASYFMNLHRVFLTLAGAFLHPQTLPEGIAWGAMDVSWTPLQHVLTEFRVVTRYLFLILLPLPRFLVFDWWGFPVSTGMTEPISTALSLILIAGLVFFSVLKIRRFPFLCAGILWYFIAVSLESFFAPGLDLYFEYRNYLPLAGLAVGVAGQTVLAAQHRIRTGTLVTAAVLLGLLLGTATFSRNAVWKDSVTLWGDTVSKAPSNIRAMIALGNAYFLSSDPGNAESHYREAVRLSAAGKKSELLDAAVYRLGLLYLFENDLGKAKRLIDTEGRQLDSCRLTILKGFYTSLKGDSDGALKIYRGVLPLTRGDDTVVVLTLTGDALREKGMWDEAIENYRRAVAMDTGFPAAYYGMGMAYLGKEDIPKADENISMTLSLQPDHVLALSDKADILLMRREPSRALEYTKKSLSQSPPFYRPYLTMGSVLIVLGRDGEAAEYYRLAKERKAPDYMVSLSIARAYSLKGDTAKAREHLSELKRYPLPENVRRLLQ